MQCFKCGSFISEGSRFCGSCGVQVSDPAAATVLTTETDPIVEAVRRDLGGEFEIERELGRGGMGVVFRAREIDLDRVVALKVMPPDMAVHRDLAERFRREARLAAALDHPNIIPIYGVGQSGGTFYIAMKYVEGRGIDAIIDSEGALPVPVVLLVLRAAAGALAFAHQRGIIHRDIKGANILVGTDGRVVVADFGIARAMEASSLTATGSVIGTPHFMSPEQCAGTSLGPQCDQYSLGVVAFQMLTGSVPFDGETMATIITHHFVTPVPDVLSVRTDVPPTLVTVLERAMAKKAEDRFASTHELVEALERVPITDAARRDGEAMLRALAAGESVGRIATTPITRSNPFDLASARAAEAARTPRPATGAGGTRPLPVPAPSPIPRARAATPPEQVPPAAGRGGSRSWIWALLALVILAIVAVAALRPDRVRRPGAELRRGAAMYAAGRRAEARAAFTRAARANPRLAAPHIFLGRMAREERDLATARWELQRAMLLEPRNAVAVRELAGVMLASGDAGAARDLYVRALQLAPGDRAAQGYLGCTLVRLGRADEGRRWLERAGPGGWRGCAETGR